MAIGGGSAEERAAEVLPWMNGVFPGSLAAYTAGSAVRAWWARRSARRRDANSGVRAIVANHIRRAGRPRGAPPRIYRAIAYSVVATTCSAQRAL